MDFEKLVRRAFHNEVQLESVAEMEKGASTRRYFRASLRNNDISSVVIMVLPEDAMKSDELVNSSHAVELPFLNVQRYLAAAGLPVPCIYLDAVTDGAVVLEDLGTVTFNGRIRDLAESEKESWYMAAVTLLARMHDVMWPIPTGCLAAQRFFDYSLLRQELDHYREYGIEARTGTALSQPLRHNLDLVFDRFAAQLDALPKGFVHRDYQSRNLMVTGDTPDPASLTVIDFQDAFIGPRIYDLVALLNDSYVELSEACKQRVIERYAALRKFDPIEVRAEFDLLTIQRKLKDGGRFVFIDRVRNDSSFLPFVATSFRRVQDALSRSTGLDKLKQTLAEADPEFFSC